MPGEQEVDTGVNTCGLVWPQEIETNTHVTQVPGEDQWEGVNSSSIFNKRLSAHCVPGTVLATGDTAITVLVLGRLHSGWRERQSINKEELC